MKLYTHEILERKIIIRIKSRICETADELLDSSLFRQVLKNGIKCLQAKDSPLLSVFAEKEVTAEKLHALIQTLKFLTRMEGKHVIKVVTGSEEFLRDKGLFNDFIEFLYNYWRSFDRFIICGSVDEELDKRPYRTFNTTIEQLMHLIRAVYRDVEENVTRIAPKIFRQVRAGAEVATIAAPKTIAGFHETFEDLKPIPFIRQILLYPPLILEPPMNKRSGHFEKTTKNLYRLLDIKAGEWLCYPARVGPLVIFIYFHQKFYDLGFSLCNLFELADDNDLSRPPAAVYFYGVSPVLTDRSQFASTVFFDDEKNNLLLAMVPNTDDFGYFGYLKKMVLTLHNVIMMKRGLLPFHGALVRIFLRGAAGRRDATVLIVGDTGAGKSETLEALRTIGSKDIREMVIVADDMGSLTTDGQGNIVGYGTETGAFLRLDDLKAGYAFGQIDRAIIMSPSKVNARIVLPVTTYANVMKGHKVDVILYANNYEELDAEHPIVERFATPEQALKVFSEGTVMSKGTTTSTGIVHSYFANIFGPPQYKELHDELARKFFRLFFQKGLFVGQVRTRLGISGLERKGPEEAAGALLDIIRREDRRSSGPQ